MIANPKQEIIVISYSPQKNRVYYNLIKVIYNGLLLSSKTVAEMSILDIKTKKWVLISQKGIYPPLFEERFVTTSRKEIGALKKEFS